MSPQAAYEQVFYPSFPRPSATPNRLAAVATLFGLRPTPPASARVLEVGCSDGGNLLPFAVAAPGARCVGIDLSPSAVEQGRKRIAALGLGNVELHALDVADFPDEGEPFDYIIAHGVYSWVPPAVRERVLAILARRLSPEGVAYVDYNAQPGSQLRYLFRGAMRFHARRFVEPKQQVDQARALVKLIADHSSAPELYRRAAESELKRLLRTPDAVVFHDDLAEVNEAFHFHEFAAAADRHGLQYLGEAEIATMSGMHLPPSARDHLATLRDAVEREQYLDLLEARAFRQTLLCHAGRVIDRRGSAGSLASLWFSCAAKVTRNGPAEELTLEAGRRVMKTAHPHSIALAEALRAVSPGRLSWGELTAEARQRLAPAASAPDDAWAAALLHFIAAGVVEIHAMPAPFTLEVAEKPAASPLARYQASNGESIATLAHRLVESDHPDARRVLPLLDGSRVFATLMRESALDEPALRETLGQLAGQALLLRESYPSA
jgi:SAM-dependent methyltransferase/methyltransferase-like protein